jgi:hypothetical protein
VLADELACAVAFREGQQVVIPFVVCVSAQVRRMNTVAYDAYIDAASGVAIDGVERLFLRSGLNLLNGGFPSEPPVVCIVADMGDVFVGALPIRLVDACDFIFFHREGLR